MKCILVLASSSLLLLASAPVHARKTWMFCARNSLPAQFPAGLNLAGYSTDIKVIPQTKGSTATNELDRSWKGLEVATTKEKELSPATDYCFNYQSYATNGRLIFKIKKTNGKWVDLCTHNVGSKEGVIIRIPKAGSQGFDNWCLKVDW